MLCPNYTGISSHIATCKVLHELGIPYIPSENRSGGPCNQCKKEWINKEIPTNKTLTKSMKTVIDNNGRIEPPTITEQAKSLANAIKEWAFNGFANTPQADYDLRVKTCQSNECGLYDKEQDRCVGCGCQIQKSALNPGKASFPKEECPAGRWTKLGLEVINNVPQTRCGSCGGK